MFPAGNGDAFLIDHCGAERSTVLIDGGYASTFDQFISPELTRIARDGVCLDLVVITHIDSDHISGLLSFFEKNGPAALAEIIPVKNVWHNSLRCLSFRRDGSSELNRGDHELLRQILDAGYATSRLPFEHEISASQGSSLSSALSKGGYVWNENNGSSPIVAPFELALNPALSLRVLGPTETRLLALRNFWLTSIRRLGVTGTLVKTPLLEDVFEFLCSYEASGVSDPATISGRCSIDSELADVYTPDTSITNGSSLSISIQAGPHRLLFPGDSWAEDLELSLSSVLVAPVTIFDAIKLSHHGSLHNTSPRLLSRIDSPHFLVSTDGEKHGHPDVEVLKAIVDRPGPFERHLHFNVRTPASRFMSTYASKSGCPFSVHEDATTITLM
jgi:hypothetical protein